MPESSGRGFLIKRSIYNPWTLAFSYQFIFEISCCFLEMIRYLIYRRNDRRLPEHFEVPKNFFQIRKLLSASAVFSSILFFDISVIVHQSFWTNQILKVTGDNSFRPFFLCWFEICFPKFVPSSKIQLTRHLTRRTIKSSYRYRLMMFKIFQVRSEKSDSCRLRDFLSCYKNQGSTDSESL